MSNHLCIACRRDCNCPGRHMLTDCERCTGCRPVLVTNQLHEGTDDLCVEFYSCPRCGFERIPKQQDNDYARQASDRAAVTAKFCPGCGSPITWA